MFLETEESGEIIEGEKGEKSRRKKTEEQGKKNVSSPDKHVLIKPSKTGRNVLIRKEKEKERT